VGRHDVLRQGSLLDDIAKTGRVPVPEVLAVDAESPPVVILSWAKGEAAEPILDMEAGSRPAELLHARFVDAAETLARLHALDPTELPAASGEATARPEDELARWQPTMETVEPELREGAEALYAALASRVPKPRGRASSMATTASATSCATTTAR